MERLLCNYLSCACIVFTENCTEIRLANIGLHKEIVSPHIYLGLIFGISPQKINTCYWFDSISKTLRFKQEFATNYFDNLLPSSEIGNNSGYLSSLLNTLVSNVGDKIYTVY